MTTSSSESNWRRFQELIETRELPALGPEPRKSRRPADEVEDLVAGFVGDHTLSDPLGVLLRSAALLWHDHLDESHAISQSIDTQDGSFLHGIMHRREPDYGNAKYWFRRVGTHSAFPGISARVAASLKDAGQEALLLLLCPGGRWDPFAFVDACENAGNTGQETVLREVQAIEFESLLTDFFRRY